MRGTKLVLGASLLGAAALVQAAGGCSVETKASDVICLANQSAVCNDCTKDDPSDTRTYRGRHTCSSDGKAFGPCEQCAPVIEGDTGFIPIPEYDAGPPPPPPPPNTPSIDAACAGKLGVLAGRDAADEQFTYAAAFQGKTDFKVFSTSGAPMRSPAAIATDGSSVWAVYRSKSDAIVASTFTGGLWSAPAGVPGASTDTAPAVVTWGPKLKAIWHDDDGRYHVANRDPATGWETTFELVGAPTAPALPKGSAPSAAMYGGPGVPGAAILFGYTDGTTGLYRQEWRGSTAAWRTDGIKATTVTAIGFRPAVVTMAAGKYDLISAYVVADGVLHAATRTTRDNGNIWSEDAVVSDLAMPLEAANGVGLPGGRALLVYRDKEKKGWFTVFDPAKTPSWSAPAALVKDDNPVLASTPQLVRDTCGAEATLAYAVEGGEVAILRFVENAWKGPFAVRGISKVTYATVVAAP